jgi:hypothetical protein
MKIKIFPMDAMKMYGGDQTLLHLFLTSAVGTAQ